MLFQEGFRGSGCLVQDIGDRRSDLSDWARLDFMVLNEEVFVTQCGYFLPFLELI